MTTDSDSDSDIFIDVLNEIYTTVIEDDGKCKTTNALQWTTWNSMTNPADFNGDDYETLQNHRLDSLFP